MVDLLRHKANLDIHPNNGKTITWLAAKSKQWELVDKLSNNADVNIHPRLYENRGETIIWLAAEDEQWWLVEKLIDKSNLNIYGSYGQLVINLTAKSKQWKLVKKMSLKHDINTMAFHDKANGESVVWLAAEEMELGKRAIRYT